MDLDLNKKDLIFMTLLSLLYLSLSVYRLGALQIPSSSWESSAPSQIIFKFNDTIEISSLYAFLGEGKTAIIDIYVGTPENWVYLTSFEDKGYYQWKKIDLDEATQNVLLSFPPHSGEIVEIAFLDPNGELISLDETDVFFEGEETHDAGGLIDEQEKIELPITSFSEAYFDEIYYVRGAEDYVEKREIFEQTHPPLGKLLIALGTLVFGFNPNGWRIMSTLFATMIIPLMYALSKNIFQSRTAALISGFLLSVDFMHFTMGRIATPETFVVFFNLASCLCFYINYRNLQETGKIRRSSVFLGFLFFSLAFSIKWYAIFGLIGQVFLILLHYLRDAEKSIKDKVKGFITQAMPILSFSLLMSIAVYFLTYIPYMLQGHGLADVYKLQWEMLGYHSNLRVKHPFSSPWWSWPLISRPLWLTVNALPDANVSTIASMGNPLIWWIGIVFVILTVERAVRDRDDTSIFIAATFLFQWVPFSLLRRVLFIYHFYINVPILILAVTLYLHGSWRDGEKRKMVVAYLIATAAAFALFYPVISGAPIPDQYRLLLRWLPSWLF